jgi:hypothetical protein
MKAFSLLAAIGLALVAQAVSAQTYGFSCVTDNAASSCADGMASLRMQVSAGVDPHSVDFTFTNFSASAPSSSITEVYFADGSLLSLASVSSSAGVTFSQVGSGSPPDLPGGKNLTPAFVTTTGFVADIGSGSNAKGVENLQPGGVQEFVTIHFILQPGKSFADTIAALDGPLGDGNDLRVGVHVRGFAMPFGATMSESFVNASAVPEPSGSLALGLVSAAALLLRRRVS